MKKLLMLLLLVSALNIYKEGLGQDPNGVVTITRGAESAFAPRRPREITIMPPAEQADPRTFMPGGSGEVDPRPTSR